MAFRKYPSEELARAAESRVLTLANELSADSRRAFGQQCRREMDWLEARGLDADFLPEPDGESEFFVRVTHGQPVPESQGARGYS